MVSCVCNPRTEGQRQLNPKAYWSFTTHEKLVGPRFVKSPSFKEDTGHRPLTFIPHTHWHAPTNKHQQDTKTKTKGQKERKVERKETQRMK